MCRQERKEPTSFCGIYGDLVEVIGLDNVKKIYDNFRGQQISFPMHLYTSEYVAQIAINLSGNGSIKILASQYDYSERHIARKVKEMKEMKEGEN